MFRILDQDATSAIIKCDRSLVHILEDIYDSSPTTYSSLHLSLSPEAVLRFIAGLAINGRSTTKIS